MSVVGAGSFAFPGAELSGSTGGGLPAPASRGVAPSLADFAKSIGVKAELAKAVAEALGVTEENSLEDFAFLDEDDYKVTLNTVTLNEQPLNPIMKAQAMRLFHQARTQGAAAGLPVPGVITPPRPQEQTAEAPKVEATVLKQSAYLNQGSEATFPLLNPGDLQKYRDNYAKIMGVEPPLSQRPTDEQLSALLALLGTGRAPFADFAVFGPFDEIQARLRKYTDQVFVDGRLQTRMLHGPSTFAAWQGCWGVFKAAMIMLDAASQGALNQYEEGLRQLTTMYGSWACISRSETTMRATQWTIILEEARRAKPQNFDESKPWDFVISASSFGVEHGMRSHWWWLHVVGPLSASGGVSTAMAIADRLDGRPTDMRNEAPPNKKAKASRSQTSAPLHPVGSSHAEGACYAWNDGGCSEPCPRGRSHVCRYCSGPHRGKDCRNKPSSSYGKGGGNNGGKDGQGKGGKGGSKKNKARRDKKAGKSAGKSMA